MARLDEESVEFLRSVMRHGGEATTDKIRSDTGLTRDQIDYRYEKLEDMELIEIQKAEEPIGGGGFPPRIAVLTDEAEQRIRKGDLGGDLLDENEEDEEQKEVTVTVSQFEEFQEELERLESRVDTLSAKLHSHDGPEPRPSGENAGGVTVDGEVATAEDIEALQQDIERAERTVQMLQEHLSKKAPLGVIDTVDDVEDRLDDLEETVEELDEQMDYVYRWMGLAERYMKATRYIFENQLDVDFDAALEAVDEDSD